MPRLIVLAVFLGTVACAPKTLPEDFNPEFVF